jgi:predicted NBD/HSP70 family sugar kinase
MTRFERYAGPGPAPGPLSELFAAVRSGSAVSRSSLARTLGLAPSTVSLRVEALRALGLITEDGTEDSRGGRRARRLSLVPDAGFVAAVDIGASHATLVLADLTGQQRYSRQLDTPLPADPAAFAGALHAAIGEGFGAIGMDQAKLRAIAIGVPAPVTFPGGHLVMPTFLPAWHDADLPSLLAAHTSVPVLIENDANLLALAESALPDRAPADDLLAVKLGARFGCGIITAGRLYRGVSGAAGEIGHSAVEGEAVIPCTCSIPNCVESIASGGAIAVILSRRGYRVNGPADVVALSQLPDPIVTEVLREAGSRIGKVLASAANLLNPREVVLGGMMSASFPYVATIRAELLQRCLPLVANDLEVRAAQSPSTAAIRGATLLALGEALAPARIDAMARAQAAGSG